MSDDPAADCLKTFRQHLAERKLLTPSHDNTYTLLRFLIEAKFDIDTATYMWESLIEWKKKIGVDKIIQEKEKIDLHHFFPTGCHGVDKTGNLVYIECFGRADHSKFRNIKYGERFMRAYVHNFDKIVAEKLPACSRLANKPIGSITLIIDLDGWHNLVEEQCSWSSYNQASKCHNYYPQVVHQIFYINCGWGLRMVYSIIKLLVPRKYSKVFHVLGRNYKEKLLESIDEDQLPVFLGGSCLCEGYRGCLGSDKGPWKVLKEADAVQRNTIYLRLVMYLNKVVATDKLCRAIQYGAKFLSNGKPGTAQNVDKSITLARKVLRLFMFVNDLHALIRPTPAETPLSLRLLGKMKFALFSTFLILDQILLLWRSGIYKNKERMKLIRRISLYFWMSSSVCSTLVELEEIRQRYTRKEPKRSVSMIKAAADTMVVFGLLELAPKRVTRRVTRAFGLASSLISLLSCPVRNVDDISFTIFCSTLLYGLDLCLNYYAASSS